MASSGQIGFPLGGSRFTPTNLRGGPGVGGPLDAAAAVASDWLLPALAEHPIEAALIGSTAAVYAPTVAATVDAAATPSAASVPGPAIKASIVAASIGPTATVAGPIVGAAITPTAIGTTPTVFAPTVGGETTEPSAPASTYWQRPRYEPPARPKPKKKPKRPPVLVERPAIVIEPPAAPIAVEWVDPVEDEELAVVAALYATNPW